MTKSKKHELISKQYTREILSQTRHFEQYRGKTVLLTFTGGMDSLFLLDTLLLYKAKVYAIYIEQLGHPAAKVELARVRAICKDRGVKLTHVTNTPYQYGNIRVFYHTQMIANLSTVTRHAAMFEYIMFGIVSGDNEVSHISEYKKIWSGFRAVSRYPPGFAKLVFPITKVYKLEIEAIYANIPKGEQDYSTVGFSCEAPKEYEEDLTRYTECQSCPSCKLEILEFGKTPFSRRFGDDYVLTDAPFPPPGNPV